MVNSNPAIEIPRGLWESDLEMSISEALRAAGDSESIRLWLNEQRGPQLESLSRIFGRCPTSNPKDQRAALAEHGHELAPYVVVDRHASRWGRCAVAELASVRLPSDVIESCGGVDHETANARALLYALYAADPSHLRAVHHMDKVNRTGFARMTIEKPPRQPDRAFDEFLSVETLLPVLAEFDQRHGHGGVTELLGVLHHKHHRLVVLRRPERPQCIWREGQVAHGHRCEWMLLDFGQSGRRVSISSQSADVPLDVASAIASAFYGRAVQYSNECQITYAAQIARLLNALKVGTCAGLEIVGLKLDRSPLRGVPLSFGEEDPDLVRGAIADAEAAFGSLTDDIDGIGKVKVLFAGRRVEMQFEGNGSTGDEFAARYMDHRLNAILRQQFEDLMRDTHGIPILSTEKRFSRQPRARGALARVGHDC